MTERLKEISFAQEEFNQLLKKIESNDPGFKDLTPEIFSISSFVVLQQLAIAISKNTYLTTAPFYIPQLSKKSNLLPNLSEELKLFPVPVKLYSDFFDAIYKKNSALAERRKRYDESTWLSKFTKNLHIFFLYPIFQASWWIRGAFAYSIGFEWVFDLYRKKYMQKGEAETYPVFKIPYLFLGPRYGTFQEKYEVMILNFRYPKNASAILFPWHYLIRTIGMIIGALIGLVIAIPLLPVAFIKSFVDFFSKTEHENDQKRISQAEKDILKANEQVIEKACELIFPENLDYVLDFYTHLKEGLPEDKKEIFEGFTNSLTALFEKPDLDDTTKGKIKYILGSICLDNSSEKQAYRYFKEIPENHPYYAKAQEKLNVTLEPDLVGSHSSLYKKPELDKTPIKIPVSHPDSSPH